jgi:hypothetical protein
MASPSSHTSMSPSSSMHHSSSFLGVSTFLLIRILALASITLLSINAVSNCFFAEPFGGVYDILTTLPDFGMSTTATRTMIQGKRHNLLLQHDTSELEYKPSWSENYIVKHAKRLGYDRGSHWISGCAIWRNRQRAPTLHDKLHQFLDELNEYQELLSNLPLPIIDHRQRLLHNDNACNVFNLHPQGLPGIFASQELSWSSSAGYMEPLFPPFRHPDSVCPTSSTTTSNNNNKDTPFPFSRNLLDRTYMVHDYAALCRKLHPHARTVLIDMGAALDFHAGEAPPALELYREYHRLGFHFDHIYGYERTPKNATQVYATLPMEFMAAFHWINTGVTTDPDSFAHPLYTILLQHFYEDDFVVIKLDIDTTQLEMELIQQIIQDPRLHRRIDVLYFEHHVKIKELQRPWKSSASGSILSSMEIFQQLRQVGIAAHPWI